MRRCILTGAPGSGKTSIIKQLAAMGCSVVEEAATDIISAQQALGIAEPWTYPDFIDDIVRLQKQRQEQAVTMPGKVQFFDRSPIDAYVLCLYLGFTPTPVLMQDLERIKAENIYHSRVFFIENLGFCVSTAARQISFAAALEFEKLHEKIFQDMGYSCLKITKASLEERVQAVLHSIEQDNSII